MNAPATVAPIESGKVAANEAIVRGRILEVNKGQKATYTDVVLPAPDAYSQPFNIRIVSSRLLGRPGDDITVRVQLKGYRRAYTDKVTGELRYGCDISLSAVEA